MTDPIYISPLTYTGKWRLDLFLNEGQMRRHQMNYTLTKGLFYVHPLTLYHTIPTFNDPREEGFGKHCGKRRKCWLSAFFFSHSFLLN